MRFFCEKISAGFVQIEGPEAHHIIHVLRMQPGEAVELFDGNGTVAQGVIDSVSRHGLSVGITALSKAPPLTTGRVIVVVSIAKGERFDMLVEKCTEAGVDRICPAIFDRTVKLAKGTNVLDRLEKIALAASKQSYRDFLPRIDAPLAAPGLMKNLITYYPGASLLYGSTNPAAVSVFTHLSPAQDVIALIGPEGGFTESEEQSFKDHSAAPVKLTNTVLRIETAAIAFASILCTWRDSNQAH